MSTSWSATEAALAEVRDRALQATDVAFVITGTSADGLPILWVNAAFTRVTGYPADQVIGRNPAFMHGPGTDRSVARRVGDAIRAEQSITQTLLNYRADGTPFWNQISLAPIRDAVGTLTQWVGIQVDVTSAIDQQTAQQHSIERERRARTGLALVAQVSDRLADAEDPRLLAEIAELLVPTVGSWCGFFLSDGGLHEATALEALPRRHRRADAETAPMPTPTATDRVSLLLRDGSDAPVSLDVDKPGAAGTPTAWLAARLRPMVAALPEGRRTVVVQPVVGPRRVFGLLVVVPTDGGGLAGMDSHDLMVLSLVARRTAAAVDTARLYAREHQLAETLQRAMLPEQAQIEDLDVWTYYAPSSEHAQVGGDWYDVLRLAPDRVGVVIGDVVGHDVEAAAAMGQLRSVVRAYVVEMPSPGEVLQKVDQLVTGMRVPRAASLVLAALTRTGCSWRLEYSRAGHLPVLLLRDGSVTALDGAAGPMIGFSSGVRRTAQLDLDAGDVLLFYTDGLVERRDRSLRDGVDALVAAATRIVVQDATSTGERLLADLADAPEDDIALVVLRVPDAVRDAEHGAQSRQRSWKLPGDPAAIGRARQVVLRTCRAWGMAEIAAAELVVSELVANAVLHGWGDIGLRVLDTGAGLRVEVEDGNPAPPVMVDGHPDQLGGYGMQIVERLADWGWRPTLDGKLVWARVRQVPDAPDLTTAS